MGLVSGGVVTINIPRTELTVQPAGQERADTALLHAATETRLQDQISMRLAGNVIWARPLIEKRRKQSAGKGGAGKQTVVSYEYFASFAVAFAIAPCCS